eukprot:6233810-Ditylum_brightwellii.AAC.1
MARCALNSYLPNRLHAIVLAQINATCEEGVKTISFSFIALPLSSTVLLDDPIKLKYNCQNIL